MTNDDLTTAVRNLVAIQRDLMLGYPYDELHMDPLDAIEQGRDALEAAGESTEELIGTEYEEKLGL